MVWIEASLVDSKCISGRNLDPLNFLAGAAQIAESLRLPVDIPKDNDTAPPVPR